MHGYYIEVGRAAAGSVPPEYVRRQTLKHAERYITPELKRFEDAALTSQARALKREKLLYERLVERLDASGQPLRAAADALASLDVLAAFAERSEALDLVAPELSESPGIDSRRGTAPRRGSGSRPIRSCRTTYASTTAGACSS